MPRWLRYEFEGREGFGILEDDAVLEQQGDLFAAPAATGRRLPLAALRLLPPCRPRNFIGLWNNFAERAAKEGLRRPDHPLYFLKGANSHAAHGDPIPRPPGYAGHVVFEAELGIVIGRRCSQVAIEDAAACVFGYTCVNDVTARDLMRLDPAFVHWTRAKSFDRFGVFGPAIATGLDPMTLRVTARVNGELRQDYPVSDMFFPPLEIVSRISRDMTLEPGDLIACGTSVGAGPLRDGDTIEVAVTGIGRLANVFGDRDAGPRIP